MRAKYYFPERKLLPIVLLLVFVSLIAYGETFISQPEIGVVISSENIDVIIQDHKFTPDPIIVPLNATVTWTNKDGMSHTVTSDTDLFDSHRIKVGSTFSYQFTVAGSFKYHCKYHHDMVGTVIVK